MALTVEETIAAASQLSENDPRRLIEALKPAEPDPRHRIGNFEASVRDFGKVRTPRGYVNQERDSWVS